MLIKASVFIKLHCKIIFAEHIVLSFADCIIARLNVFANGQERLFAEGLQIDFLQVTPMSMDTTENPPSDLSVRYSQPIGIVQEGQNCSIGQGHGIELSAVLPSEGVAMFPHTHFPKYLVLYCRC